MEKQQPSYLLFAALMLFTVAIYVWYILDVARHRKNSAAMSPLSHPLSLMCSAAKALWHEQTLLFVLFVLWVSGAMGGWIRVFSMAPPQLREDRRIGLFFWDPWAAVTALGARGTAIDAFTSALPRLTLPFPGGYEGTLAPALLICIAVIVALFLSVKPLQGKTKSSIYAMLAVGLVSMVLWAMIPWAARAAQIAGMRGQTMAFRPSPQLLMILALLLQAPLSALLGSFSYSALHSIAAFGGWSWRRTTAQAAAAFLPLLWLQLVIFVPLGAVGPLVASFVPPQQVAQMSSLPTITRALGILSALAAVLLMFAGWAIVAEGDGAFSAVKRNFRFLAQHKAAALSFLLRTTAVLIPLALLNSIVDVIFAQSLGGKFVSNSFGGILNTLLLLTTASAFVQTRTGEGEAPGEPADAADSGKDALPQ